MQKCYYGIVAVNAHSSSEDRRLTLFCPLPEEESSGKKILSLPNDGGKEEASLSSR